MSILPKLFAEMDYYEFGGITDAVKHQVLREAVEQVEQLERSNKANCDAATWTDESNELFKQLIALARQIVDDFKMSYELDGYIANDPSRMVINQYRAAHRIVVALDKQK